MAMLRPRWIVAFTGHRDLANAAAVEPAIQEILAGLREKARAAGGEIDLFTGVARGADLAAAKAARSLGIPVHVILPLDPDDFERDFASAKDPDEWLVAKELIRLAEDRENGGSLRVADGPCARPDCYFDAGLQMLEGSNVLVAAWDGEDPRGTGGASDIVAQAREEDLPVVTIDAASGAIDWSGLPDAWPESDELLDEVRGWLGSTRSEGLDFEQLATEIDDIATREGGRFRPSVLTAISFHGLAAMLAALTATMLAWRFPNGEKVVLPGALLVMTAVELVLVLCALGIVFYQGRKGMHHRWLRARLAAELLRGMRATRGLLDPLVPHVTRHAPEWRQFCVGAGLQAHAELVSPSSWTDLRDRYVTDRIDDQIQHYEQKTKQARPWRQVTHYAMLTAAWSAALFVALSLCNKLGHWHWEEGGNSTAAVASALAVVWMPIGLPLIASVAAGIRTALDSRRRTSRYPDMVGRLREARRRLATVQTKSAAVATILACEEILVDENLEWYLVTSEVEGL